MKGCRIITVFLLTAALLCQQPDSARAQHAEVQREIAAGGEATAVQPFIVYYSRTGSAKKVAETLSAQLGCGMEGIDTKAKIGIGTIFLDQGFNRSSDQKPVQQNLAAYDPIILVTPIWLMRLSSPARTFIKQGALKGKQVYLFTVSGGPLSRARKDSFREFGAEHGLTVREVHSLQVGKKAPAVLEKELQEIVDSGSLKKYRTTIAGK